MAEEDTKSGSTSSKDGEGADAAPKGSLKKLIVIGVAVLLLGGGAFAGWKFFLGKESSPEADQADASAQKAPDISKAKPKIMYALKPFIVNLVGQRGQRYLKTQIALDVYDKDIEEELYARTPQLRDAVLLLLSSKSFEDISTAEGKIQLRNELIARINQLLQRGTIRGLYFIEFVVQ
jgi:flagellar FliL protein